MSNEIILQQLKGYFSSSVDVEKSDDFYQIPNVMSYDFICKGSKETVGRCELSERGRLVHFELLANVVLSDDVLAEDDLVSIARGFIKRFYPDIYLDYDLSTVFNMREMYSIYFEKKDEKLHVAIPYVGFNVGVSVDGQVVDFSFDHPEYEINYVDQMISAKEAKDKFLKNIELELRIEFCDKATYINGDHDYHLLYKVNRKTPAIPASGEEPEPVKKEAGDYVTLQKQATSYESLDQALGITNQYNKLGEKRVDMNTIEAWSRLFQTKQFEYSTYLPDDHIIKIAYDWRGQVQHILSGEFTPRLKDKLTIEEAEEKAIDFMFYLDSNADENYLLQVVEEHPVESEEFYENFLDGDNLFNVTPQTSHEEMYRFLFQRVKSGVFVTDNFISIGIGKYSGFVRLLQNNVVSEESLKHVSIRPNITKEQAKQLYEQSLQMKLSLVPGFKGQVRIYSPRYLSTFEKEHQFVEAIDAHTGELYEIDLNDPIPY